MHAQKLFLLFRCRICELSSKLQMPEDAQLTQMIQKLWAQSVLWCQFLPLPPCVRSETAAPPCFHSHVSSACLEKQNCWLLLWNDFSKKGTKRNKNGALSTTVHILTNLLTCWLKKKKYSIVLMSFHFYFYNDTWTFLKSLKLHILSQHIQTPVCFI